MAVMMVATIKRKVPIWAFLLDWPLVFLGNLCGSLFYAGILVDFTIIYTPAMAQGSATLATAKAGPAINFLQNFLRGVGCNFLVCLAVFQASMMKDGISKIAAAHFPIFCFVAAVSNQSFSNDGQSHVQLSDITFLHLHQYTGFRARCCEHVLDS